MKINSRKGAVDMTNKKRIKLHICGADYILTSDEPESYVMELGEELDRSMRNLMDADPRVSTTMAAVLTALTMADEARKATAAADNLRSQLKDYLSDNARARAEADHLRTQLGSLRKQSAAAPPREDTFGGAGGLNFIDESDQ